MTNSQVAFAFIVQEPAKTLNMECNGNVAFSWKTAIAQWTNLNGVKTIILNVTYYSPTSSKHLGMVRRAIQQKCKGVPVVEVAGVPQDTYDLIGYLPKIDTKVA